IIGNRRSGKGSLRRVGELERVCLLAKPAAALVQEQHRAVCAHDDQILPPVIIDVDQKRARCVVEDADARCFRDVLKRSVASIPIKAVRKAARLANIEVVKSIAVDVANGNAVVPVDINAASAVEHGPPIVRSVQKLRSIGSIAPQRRCRDLEIAWVGRPAQRFILRLPTPHSKLVRCGPFPGELPVAHALFPVEAVACPDQFIADASLQLAGRYRCTWHGASVNSGHLKFSRKNLGKAAQGRPQFLQKRVPPKRSFPLERVVTDFNRRARAYNAGIGGLWRRPQKIRKQNALDRAHILRRLQQTRTPLREDSRDLVNIFFGDKIVETSLRFEQQGIEGPGHPIMRMQVEFMTRQVCGGRVKAVQRQTGPAEAVQFGGNKGRRRSLAAPNQKVAPAKVHGARAGQTPHLFWPTQNDVSGVSTCRLKINTRTHDRQEEWNLRSTGFERWEQAFSMWGTAAIRCAHGGENLAD